MADLSFNEEKKNSFDPDAQHEENIENIPPQTEDTAEQNTEMKNGEYSIPHPENSSTRIREPRPGTAYSSQYTPLYVDSANVNRPQFTPPTRPAEKKKNRGIGAIAGICTLCVVLSGASAYAGTRLAGGGAVDGLTPKPDTAVIYRSVSTDTPADKTSVTDVVEAVADSVVEITTEFKSTGFFQFVSGGAGSGVIISDNGYIVTNNHVITDGNTVADNISVRLRNGTEYTAELVGREADADIAVLKVDATELTAAVFGESSKIVVGQNVVAIGNPLGELGGSVTNGIISALDREINVDGTKMNLLQTNAQVNPGNSGGGLFNMKGELIGIVNAKSSGSNIEGIGFAIPADDAARIATELMTNGYVTGKTYIGVSLYYASDAYTAYRYFRSQSPGLFISNLVKGYNDGVLNVGDRLIAVNGKEVASADDVKDIVKSAKVGDMLKVSLYRDGELKEVEVKCFEYKPEMEFGTDRNQNS